MSLTSTNRLDKDPLVFQGNERINFHVGSILQLSAPLQDNGNKLSPRMRFAGLIFAVIFFVSEIDFNRELNYARLVQLRWTYNSETSAAWIRIRGAEAWVIE